MRFKAVKLLAIVLIVFGTILLLAALLSCSHVAYDSDRNIANMSADELRRELAK